MKRILDFLRHHLLAHHLYILGMLVAALLSGSSTLDRFGDSTPLGQRSSDTRDHAHPLALCLGASFSNVRYAKNNRALKQSSPRRPRQSQGAGEEETAETRSRLKEALTS